MSDFGGDEPDTFDGRIAGIIQLVRTYDDEHDADRRQHRQDTIVRLLLQLHELADR